MRLAFLGTPAFAVPTLSALLAAGHDIACVYSQPPARRGRGQHLVASPIEAFANANRLMVRTPTSLTAPDAVAAFAALDLDAAVVVAFGQILSAEVLSAPRLGCYNLHASLLPRWRGAAPIHRAVMAGDTMTGVSVMQMSEGLDEGPVLAEARAPIGAIDTTADVHDRLAAMGAELMATTLAKLARGEAVAIPQPGEGATYAKKIRAAERAIRWDRPAVRVDRQIRGLSPHPGATFTVSGSDGSVRVKALLSRLEAGSGRPGEVLDDALLVACGEGAVRLVRVQREGRAVTPAADFLRGFPIKTGAILG
jgi:methionyl-tRNA formyltransferase